MERTLKYAVFFVLGVAVNWYVWRVLDRHFGDARPTR